MAHIMVGYELGGGHGHLYRLLPVVRALEAQGHRVTLVLRNIRENAFLLDNAQRDLLPVPDLVANIPGTDAQAPLATYLDIMCVAGFYDRPTLDAGVTAWKTLLKQAAPDLVLADHSPILLLACFGRYPVVQVADGFTLPPAHNTQFPIFRRGGSPLVEPEHVLQVMRDVQRHHGLPQPETVTEPFRTAGRLVCSLPDLDPYGEDRRDPVIGPVQGLLEPLPTPDGPPRFFAYFDLQHQVTWALLQGLRDCGMSGEVYVRGMNDEVARAMQRPGLIVHRKFQPLPEVFARASVILHHGSNGTCCAALSAGRPQIIVPTQMESRLMGDAVIARGCGQLLAGQEITPQRLVSLLNATAADRSMAERAVTLSHQIRARAPQSAVTKILDACYAALGNGVDSRGGIRVAQ
jgi:rhamnosyltransferase subunit B